MIDPADRETWPPDLAIYIDGLARAMEKVSANTAETPSNELKIGSPDDDARAESGLRSLLGDRLVAIFHATRLLPHEVEAVVSDGLVPLDVAHRSSRLDRLIEHFHGTPGAPDFEVLRSCWPLSDPVQRDVRVGRLWGVTPLEAAFKGDAEGLAPFLDNWGGEAFYFGADDVPALAEAVRWLTDRSSAFIVAAGVPSGSLGRFPWLWPIFAAHAVGWTRAWHEFSTDRHVPADQIALLSPASEAWPL